VTFYFLYFLIFFNITNKYNFPNSYKISFLDLLQQPDDITCGPTSTAMILRHYGIFADIDKVKKITKTVWYTHDGRDFGMTSPELIHICLKKFGLNAKMKCGNINELKYILSKNNPVIVLVRSGEWNWHYVVVVGYDKDMIFFANPSSGELEGLSVHEFKLAWDWRGDLKGNICNYLFSFWLRTLEIYPNTLVYIQ
jgi:ABC-type bacteriocin/lantibiotic exporter with double-glycine peptidase domain